MTRLNKRLVELGLAASRRAADELIASGEVYVNGSRVETPTVTLDDDSQIRVSGKHAATQEALTIAFNKPRGYVCSHQAQGRAGKQQTIFALLPKSFASLKIAGRLDLESQGLVILSSDGDFVQTLSHPSHQHEKEYVVHTRTPVSAAQLRQLEGGIQLDDGIVKAMRATGIGRNRIRLVLTTGKKRQIRRMLEAIDHKVIELERIRIGKYSLGLISAGKYTIIQPEDLL